jgi:chromosome segregation ATPase
MAFEKINEINNQYEESQKQVEVQNELMQQAGKSIEDLTVRNKGLEQNIEDIRKENEETIKSLHNRIAELDKNVSEALTVRNEISEKYNSNSDKVKELNRELERQKTESQLLYDENVDLKKQLEKLLPKPEIKTKIINKKTKEDNTF